VVTLFGARPVVARISECCAVFVHAYAWVSSLLCGVIDRVMLNV
jgi:hypothetical protein